MRRPGGRLRRGALTTDRFDTRVPGLFYEAIVSIGDDLQDRSVWKIPAIHQGLGYYFQGVLHEPTRQAQHAYTTNLYTATAYLGDRHKLFLEDATNSAATTSSPRGRPSTSTPTTPTARSRPGTSRSPAE